MTINSVADLHTFLDADISSINVNSGFTNQLRRLCDDIEDQDIKDAVILEVALIDFMLIEGRIDPLYKTPAPDGTVVNYPSLNAFADRHFSYLMDRAISCKNIYLTIRYNQILWNSRKKHMDFARKAIDAYEGLLAKPPKKALPDAKQFEYYDQAVNALALSIESKQKVNEILSSVHHYLFENKASDDTTKIFLLEYLVDQKQIKTPEFSGTLNLVKRIGAKARKGNPSLASERRIYELGLRAAGRLNGDLRIWHKRLGDAYVRYADQRMNDSTKMVPMSFLDQAIVHYKNGVWKVLEGKATKRYIALKNELKLSQVEIDLMGEDGKEIYRVLTGAVDYLITQKPLDIIDYLIDDGNLPKVAELKMMYKERKKSIHFHVATLLKFDINKNITKKSKSDKVVELSWEDYDIYLRAFTLPFLQDLFRRGILENKVSYLWLIEHFEKRTWLGIKLPHKGLTGEDKSYSWLSMIAPALLEFFNQMEMAYKLTPSYYNLVLALDSLTLKFEGALRDFGEKIGISPSKMRKGDALQEVLLHDILSDDKLKKYFADEDLLLFKFLLVEKEGYNLRNNIAHAFYQLEDYSPWYMFLLIFAFLRLGKPTINITIQPKII